MCAASQHFKLVALNEIGSDDVEISLRRDVRAINKVNFFLKNSICAEEFQVQCGERDRLTGSRCVHRRYWGECKLLGRAARRRPRCGMRAV